MPKIHKKEVKLLKQDFLDKLTEHSGMTYATAMSMRITYNTYLKWVREDEEFKKACFEREELQIDIVENRLMELIMSKENPPPPSYILFYLKCRRPAKWNDKAGQQININVIGTEFQLGGDNSKVGFVEWKENKLLEESENE